MLLSSPALAQTYGRADIIRGLCQPDGCDEFAILAASPLATDDEGKLMKTRVKTFHASSSGRRELGEENGYVYCSRTKPAIVAEKNGRTMAFYLAPFATQESHGLEAGRAAVQNLSRVAQDLGYRVALPQSQYVALTRVEDVLAPAGRPREAKTDLLPPSSRNLPPAATHRDMGLDERVDALLERHAPSSPKPSADAVEQDEGLLAGPRRLTNRAFDALDEVGDWVLGRRY